MDLVTCPRASGCRTQFPLPATQQLVSPSRLTRTWLPVYEAYRMTSAGLGLAGSRLPVSQLVIKVVVLGGHFSCGGDERHFLVGEVLEPDQRGGRGCCG
jgi:hypothetical protein